MVLGPSLDDFAPDLVFRHLHVLDQLTRRSVPSVVLYDGGYNRDRIHTARIHVATVTMAATYANRHQFPALRS